MLATIACMAISSSTFAATRLHIMPVIDADTATPVFSWEVSSKKPVSQVSYHILVATSVDSLKAGIGDVWDSGTVITDSTRALYPDTAQALKQHTTYHYSIEVVTAKSKKSIVATGTWNTCLLGKPLARSAFIGFSGLLYDEQVEEVMGSRIRFIGRYVRKVHTTSKVITKATAYCAGPGGYVFHVNGKRVSAPFAGLLNDDAVTIAYDVYDITSLITQSNVFAAELGAGNYYLDGSARHYYDYPRFFANIIIEYADSTTQTIVTDNTWKLNTAGPLRFTAASEGECYDARREFGDWTAVEYNDSAWAPAEPQFWPKKELRLNDKEITSEDLALVSVALGRVHITGTATEGDTIAVRLTGGDREAVVTYVAAGGAFDYAPEFSITTFSGVEVSAPRTAEVRVKREEIREKR